MSDDTDATHLSAMFEDGNRVRFLVPVDSDARAWWVEDVFSKHGLTPEGVGDLITESVHSDKTILYRYIDGKAKEFALAVKGRLRDDGDLWFVDRTISLSGRFFNAEEMFVPPQDRMGGVGRRLMGDLIRMGELFGANRIKIHAQDIGRYAWLRMGFRPDDGSWRSMQQPLAAGLGDIEDVLGRARVTDLTMQIMRGRPDVAFVLANLHDMVPSRSLKGSSAEPVLIPLGKRLFLEQAGSWTGEFDLVNESLVHRAKAYAAG